ncbi:MAG: hypothetical protein ABIW32_00630 [Terrimesophilobacter sp.]
MAKESRSTETDVDTSTTASPEPQAEASQQSHPAPANSTRTRWVLPSLAGAGLLILGLLGGMLIGQQMSSLGAPNGPMPRGIFMFESGADQNSQIPEEIKQRIKEYIHEQMQERRDYRNAPGQIAPSPTPTTPGDSGSTGSGETLDAPPENNG